jgi:hypothetical protein
MRLSERAAFRRSLEKDFIALREYFRELPPNARVSSHTAETFIGISKSTRFNAPRFLKLTGSMAVFWTTQEELETNSHRLIVPEDDEGVLYHREAFEIDIGRIPSRTVDLTGIEEIVTEPKAVTEIARLAGRVGLLSEYEWRGMTVREDDLVVS